MHRGWHSIPQRRVRSTRVVELNPLFRERMGHGLARQFHAQPILLLENPIHAFGQRILGTVVDLGAQIFDFLSILEGFLRKSTLSKTLSSLSSTILSPANCTVYCTPRMSRRASSMAPKHRHLTSISQSKIRVCWPIRESLEARVGIGDPRLGFLAR